LKQGHRIVIVGASSRIAEHCARLWALQGPSELVLVGRDLARLDSVASDLRVRAPAARVTCLSADFEDPAKIQALADGLCAERPVDIVLIAHGSLPVQEACQTDLSANRDALTVNGLSPVLFAEAFAGHLAKAGQGALAVIGSVAGDRGRKSNYVYGAAKGLVTRYLQGLQHRLAGTGVKVVLVKPGPTDTPMTAQMKQSGARLADPASVARSIVDGIAAGRPVVYAPAKWALIMMVIRHLPARIFNKLNI
jgi:decaprenylphospho-beta-D-erythro-pentofuranosid-2-ulose 2-reductase